MNVGMIFKSATSAIKGFAGNGLLLAKKYTPEIMITSGIVGFGLTIIGTVRATNKTNDILDRKEIRSDRIETEHRLNDEYSVVDYEADKRAVTNQTRWELIKTWAPVATTGVASVVMVLGGYRVLNGRYVATAAAYKTLEAGFERYRGNVVDEFGKDVDWRMAHSIKAEELEEARKERDEKTKALTTRKKRPKTAYTKQINNQIFDCHSDRWQRYWLPEQVLDFVQRVEREIQDLVRLNGHAFLNDAYDRLGLPRTTQGAVLGWIDCPKTNHNEKGNLVSLGYANDETPEEEIRRILSSPSNEEIWLWISPNCDGVIYTEIDKPYEMRFADR